MKVGTCIEEWRPLPSTRSMGSPACPPTWATRAGAGARIGRGAGVVADEATGVQRCTVGGASDREMQLQTQLGPAAERATGDPRPTLSSGLRAPVDGKERACAPASPVLRTAVGTSLWARGSEGVAMCVGTLSPPASPPLPLPPSGGTRRGTHLARAVGAHVGAQTVALQDIPRLEEASRTEPLESPPVVLGPGGPWAFPSTWGLGPVGPCRDRWCW